MGLEKDIKAAIDISLSAQVGKVLKERLEKGESDAKELVLIANRLTAARAELLKATMELEQLRNLGIKAKEVLQREQKVEAKEEQLLIVLRHTEVRVSDMKELVSLVFQNNRYKHNKGIATPCKDQYGNPSSEYSSENTTVEG